MDPNACLDALLDAFRDGNRETAWQHMEDLYDWLAKGGFMPADPRKNTEDTTMSDYAYRPMANGTVLTLRRSASFAMDIFDALELTGSQPPDRPFSVEDIEKIIRADKVGQALRAEAGYRSGPSSLVLSTHSETLQNGLRLLAFLMVWPLPIGDALSWVIVPDDKTKDEDDLTLLAATRQGLNSMLAVLRVAAGGPSMDISERPADVPSAEELDL